MCFKSPLDIVQHITNTSCWASRTGTPSAISVNRQAGHQDKQVTFMDMLPGG